MAMSKIDSQEHDAVELARALIRCPSVTPADEGALDILQSALSSMGFICTRLPFEDIDNLYAEIGEGSPHLCFAGHTDVVPPGAADEWTSPPFGAELIDGSLWGRGAADMKGAIAAFTAAAARALKAGANKGKLSFLITGDEEAKGVNGTVRVLQWMRDQNINIDHCLVGEPSNPDAIGDMIKVGRRGSINCWLTVTGKQGHVAYPHRAQNPIPSLMRQLLMLSETPLDEGYERFQPSSLQVTDIHIGNPAHNVIPGKASARFNIRFNPNWTGASVQNWLREKLDSVAKGIDASYVLDCVVSGEAFLTTDEAFLTLLSDCIETKTGRRPELSTSGGTSDARFIKDYAPVAEFGLVGATMHQIDEHVSVADIAMLTDIYEAIIGEYFARFGD
ncbi:succinyl-diaminopimelate desuccinylase [Hyphococcus sp.]|uniref:succinyl-diaminopimelate desuccinylase n=1 Tax=Hyphococcus sp. TaxID=2038636 RepID=UPI0020880673|nr:MAG: succinyl-diaminopimelate desuccinylase [Marinicaulis sp.]